MRLSFWSLHHKPRIQQSEIISTTTTATTTMCTSNQAMPKRNISIERSVATIRSYIRTYTHRYSEKCRDGALRGGVLFTLYFCRMFLSVQIGGGAIGIDCCAYAVFVVVVVAQRRRDWKIFQLRLPLPVATLSSPTAYANECSPSLPRFMNFVESPNYTYTLAYISKYVW